MNDFISDLINFVETNRGSEKQNTLVFEIDGCKISFTYAWLIAQEIQTYREWVKKQNENCEQLQDYVRLLRKENQELKGENDGDKF